MEITQQDSRFRLLIRDLFPSGHHRRYEILHEGVLVRSRRGVLPLLAHLEPVSKVSVLGVTHSMGSVGYSHSLYAVNFLYIARHYDAF